MIIKAVQQWEGHNIENLYAMLVSMVYLLFGFCTF